MTMSTDDHSIPPVRDLPAGRLGDRQQHLLAEITPQSRKRLALPSFSRPRLRLAALAVAGACAAGGAATLALTRSSGSGGSGSAAYAFQTVHGVGWTGAVFSAASLQPPKATASSPAKTDIHGGTVGQRALLHSIIGAMQPNTITKIAVTSSGNQVTLRMKATDNSMETQWQESLVAAAFRDRASAAGNHVTVALENGDQYGGIGPGPAKTSPAARPGATQTARRRFETRGSEGRGALRSADDLPAGRRGGCRHVQDRPSSQLPRPSNAEVPRRDRVRLARLRRRLRRSHRCFWCDRLADLD